MRVLFSPHEICGQMQLLAEAFRNEGHYAKAISYQTSDERKYQNDICLQLERNTKIVKLSKMLRCFFQVARDYDVFHFFYGRSLLPNYWDLPILKRMGKKIFVHFRGSDIRNGSALQAFQKDVTSCSSQSVQLQRPHQIKRVDTWRFYADRMFVSTPDLLKIVPEAELIQQVIVASDWIDELPTLINCGSHTKTKPLKIIHAPSSRWKKGTEFVLEACDQLKREGYLIDLILIEGQPQSKIRELFDQANIGIDQLLVGWYGNVSIQFMALGKPVICYIDPELRSYRPDCPIVSATPANLTEILKKLINDPVRCQKLGEQGQQYVKQFHDVNVIVDRLVDIYTQ